MHWTLTTAYPGVAALFALGATLLLLAVTGARARRLGPFVFSLTFFVALTQYPFPDPATLVCPVADTKPLLEPFGFARQLVDRLTSDPTPWSMAYDQGLLAAVANFVLCAVIGWTARLVIGRPGIIVALGAGLSLTIEMTQLTGIWGLYPCPYRLFDVDDLILNTAGVACGVAVYRLRRIGRPVT